MVDQFVADADLENAPGKRLDPWMASTIILTNVGLALLVVLGLVRFGTIGSALAYLGGDRLLVDSRSKSFGAVELGKRASVDFRFANKARTKIRLLGATSSCTCALPEGLPVTVPAGAACLVKVPVRAKGKAGHVTEKIRFYVDCPQQPVVDVTVSGDVLDAHNPAGGPG